MSQTEQDRQLARDILAGKKTVAEAAQSAPVQPASSADAPPAPDGPPLEKPPVMAKAPSTNRKFPCEQCGARLDFDPAARALKCPYCGHEQKIDPVNEKVEERDFETYLAKIAGEKTVIEGRSSEVRCPGCGANIMLEDKIATDRCPFCATHLENLAPQQAKGQIAPESVLPFIVDQRNAIAAFTNWIKTRWFAPSNLKQLANLGQLSGVYLPFWTYDSMTYTHYTGMRGDNYYVTESYTDSQGKRQTRTVTRIRWTYVSGEVQNFFDDVLICGATTVERKYIDALEPWGLEKLQGFRPDYLAGFKTQRYDIDLPAGFSLARQVMDVTIRRLCTQDIGGDHQRLNSVNTQHVGVTFKHILLPVWLAVYRYNDKVFRILVNARTGEVQGDRPWSWIKITLLVLAIIAIIIIAAILFTSAQNHTR
jgi:DNA-directed RNA polymerase subunit RPC12/RpoP